VGSVTAKALKGDSICILFGCDIPVVLRKDQDTFRRFIIDAYVDGYMNGEIFGDLKTGRSATQDFRIR
jgi:hypothetical protein